MWRIGTSQQMGVRLAAQAFTQAFPEKGFMTAIAFSLLLAVTSHATLINAL